MAKVGIVLVKPKGDLVMAGFDLSKVNEFIKAVETRVAQSGGDTNSDGKINTAEENTVFSAMLEEEKKAGNLSDDDVNKIWGFVKSNTAKAPAKAKSADINDGDSVKIEINVNTDIKIDLTVNADFKSAIQDLIENQNQNTQKLIDFFNNYMNQNPGTDIKEFLAEFIKNILNEIVGNVDLSGIEGTLNKILEQLGQTNSKIDDLKGTIIKMAEDQLKFFNNMNLKTDEIIEGIKGLSSNQEEQIAMLNTLTNVLNKLSADFGEFQGTTVNLLNNILAQIKSGDMKMDDLMEILKAIESDTSKNAETSGKILDEVAKGNEISQKILEAIKLMNKELAGVSNEVKNGFLNIVTQLVQQGANMDDIKELLDQIKGEASKNNEIALKILDAIKEMQTQLDGVNNEVKNGFLNIAAQLVQQGASMDDIKELLKQIKNETSKNNELSLAILNAIKDLGTDVSGQLTAILKAINQGNGKTDDLKCLLLKVLNNMDANTKDIINAMGNIKVDGSGNVDLSSIENMLAQLIKLGEQNNELLSGMDGKLDLINVTGKAILDKLNVEGQKGDERYEKTEATLNQILDALKNQTGGYDDSELMQVLKDLSKLFNDRMDELLEAIKDHDVNVTVDVTGKVTCECNCGNDGKHEGILGDLNTILKAPRHNTTGISDVTTGSNQGPRGKKVLVNGKVVIQGNDGHTYDLSGRRID